MGVREGQLGKEKDQKKKQTNIQGGLGTREISAVSAKSNSISDRREGVQGKEEAWTKLVFMNFVALF